MGLRRRRGIVFALGVALWLVPAASEALPEPVAYDWQFDLTVDAVTPNDFIDSFAVGQAWLHYDAISDHLSVLVTWTDLVGEIDRIHVHGAALAGVNERNHVVDIVNDASELPAGTGLHTGQLATVLHLFDGPDSHGPGRGGHYTPERALEILVSEEAYMLIHTSAYFEGEIRGQLVLTGTTVPEPTTGALLSFGIAGLLAATRVSAGFGRA